MKHKLETQDPKATDEMRGWMGIAQNRCEHKLFCQSWDQNDAIWRLQARIHTSIYQS